MIACAAKLPDGAPPRPRTAPWRRMLEDTATPTRSTWRPLDWMGVVVAVVAALLLFLQTRGVGLMGHDSYPLILTSRIHSGGDLIGTFTEQLMDGRYHGAYFRPLLNLSFALDEAIWGLDAFGYQLTNALLFAGAALALHAFARRALGAGGGFGALIAVAFFALHESHFEVVPVPARRPELLCALFACAALAAQLRPSALAARWPVLGPLLMLAAAASKETGYALPAVAVLAVYLYSEASGRRARLVHAGRAAIAYAVPIAALLGLRLWVLGGLGGPAALPPGYEGPGTFELSATLFDRLLVPQSATSGSAWLGALALFAGLGVAKSWFLGGRSKAGGPAPAAPLAARQGLLLAVAWSLIVGALYGVSRSIEQWYLFLPVVGLSLLIGSGAQLLLLQWRRGGPLVRASAVGATLLLLAFCGFQLRYTPLVHRYTEWARATTASDEFFEKLARRIERAAPGASVNAPPIPVWVPPAPTGPAVRGGAVLEDYSVQAWCELRFPDRRLRVLKAPPRTPLLAGESAVLLLRPYPF